MIDTDRFASPQAYIDRLELVIRGMEEELKEIDQTLGRALGFPRYCDDQQNFPGTTDAAGVCTGDATPAVLALMAAERLAKYEKLLGDVEKVYEKLNYYVNKWTEEDSNPKI